MTRGNLLLDDLALQYYLEDFRKQIHELRVFFSSSVEQVCNSLNITRQSLSNFENGRGTFKLVNALALSSFFDYMMLKANVGITALPQLAITRVDYPDYLLCGPSDDVPPPLPSLCYAWQRKQDQYASSALSGLLLDDLANPRPILFIDILSFLDDAFYERFLWWMMRVLEYTNSPPLEIYIDNAIQENGIVGRNPHAASFLNALIDVKKQGKIVLYAMNLNGKAFPNAIKSVITTKGCPMQQCVVVSASNQLIFECREFRTAVVTADGQLLDLSGRADVLKRLQKAAERRAETVFSAIPADLLNGLFDS